MDYTLRRIRFTEEALSLPAVQEFDCGAEPWAQEVADYLKNPNGVAEWVKKGTETWLYATENGDLVGYATLGGRKWRWPDAKKSPKQPLNIIPAVAVHKDFQGSPQDAEVKKYADQILDHLRHEATLHPDRLPVLGLCVHPLNERAIRWYKRAGFVRLDDDYHDPDTGVDYWRMTLYVGKSQEVAPAASTGIVPDTESMTRQDSVLDRQPPASESRSFEQAVSTPLSTPPLPEQRAKKAARKAKAEKRKKPKHRR